MATKTTAIPLPVQGVDALQVVQRQISSLKLNPQNPRSHSRQQLRKLEASIRTFGFVVPVIYDETGQLLCGHGRVEAARMAGLETVPAIELSHLTEAQKKAFVIADNRLTEIAEWNEALLKQQLIEISQEDPDLSLEVTGFDVAEIDLKLGIITDVDDSADEDDEVLVGEGPTVTVPGMLWRLGSHRIHCASSLKPQSFKTLCGSDLVDVGITDPPYNVAIDGHVSGNGRHKHREFAMAAGEMTGQEFTRFLTTAIGNMCSVSKHGSLHYAFMDWRHAQEMLAAGQALSLELQNIATWVKPNPGMGSFYRSQHELCFIFKHGRGRTRNNIQLGKFGRNRSNVWMYPGANNAASTGEEGKLLGLHPTAKPVRLIADIILDCTARDETVLDPFLGAGSTLIAAQRVGRRCFGLELDPAYVDTAVRRWQAFTGDQAIDALTGRTLPHWQIRWRAKGMESEKTDGRKKNRPPETSRFKSGRSGNPRGRPKRRVTNIIDMMDQESGKQISAKANNGRTVKLTKAEATAHQVVNAALRGDNKAINAILYLAGKLNDAGVFEEPIRIILLKPAPFERDLSASETPGRGEA